MHPSLNRWLRNILAGAALLTTLQTLADVEPGFKPLFNGKSLDGWTTVGKVGDGYQVENNMIVCPKKGGGNLLTEKEYANFILRLEFRLEPGSNNGVGIRAPLTGDIAYTGMEIQVLDDTDKIYKDIKPWQHHGSIYNVVAAKPGHLKPVGEWNTEEIIAEGRHIKVTLNGHVIVNTHLNDVKDIETLQRHPGLLRERGHVGFLGHDAYAAFRNIRIKELADDQLKDNRPPAGFKALFDGKTLNNWKGLVADPIKRSKMTPEQLAAEQAKADEKMRAHWHANEGELQFDGKGDNLCTVEDYSDYELYVDWKITTKGDSGIYLRGSPQVQIWDRADTGPNPKALGSGGLYNNQKNPSEPLVNADASVGKWNTFRILMLGNRVTVFLNGQLVVNNTELENYWDRSQPIFPSGSIELQNHGNFLWFKNVYVRPLSPLAKK